MIYKTFKDAELFEGATNKTYEYHIEDNDINYCIVEITGRFPLKGRLTNTVCKEMVHILDGSGLIVVDNVTYELKKDDVVLIKPGQKYYWEGNMRVGASCSPAWYPEQSHNIAE